MEPNKNKSLKSEIEEIRGLLDAGEVEEAENRLLVAVQTPTRDPEELARLGEILVETGSLEKAREIYLKLVLICPGDAAEKSLAECCLETGWDDHAAIVLDRLIERNESNADADVLRMRADLHLREENWTAARQLYEQVLRLEPDDSEAVEQMLKLSLATGLFEEGQDIGAVCRRILELDPGFEQASIILSELSDQVSDQPSAQSSKDHADPGALSFWAEQEFDTDCGIPEERIPGTFVSLVIPVCNEEAFLTVQLEELMDQNLPRGLEIVVVDYGSRENEKAVVESVVESRFEVRYVRSCQSNLVEAMNHGVKASRGEYVMFTRAANTLRRDAVLRLVKSIRSGKNLRVAYADWGLSSRPNESFDSPGIRAVYRHGAFDARNLCRVPVATGTVLMERQWLEELLFLHTDKTVVFHEFLSRTVQAGGYAVAVPEVLELVFDAGEEIPSRVAAEVERMRRSMLKDFPIESIFDVDAGDNSSMADAWVAYGNWMLGEIQGPFDRYPSDEMELAASCFSRALEFRELHDAAIQNLAIVSSALGRLEDVLAHVEKLPNHKQQQLLADIETYRRNFEKVEVPLLRAPSIYRDKWTGRNEPHGFEPADAAEVEAAEDSFGRPEAGGIRTPVRWLGSFFDESPESAAGIEWVQALKGVVDTGICHTGGSYSQEFVHSLPSAVRRKLYSMNERYGVLDHGIAVYQGISEKTRLLPDADYHIGIASSPSSRLAPGVVRKFNQLDEIWVANTFLKDVLLSSGVEQRKIRWMPVAMDENFFRPERESSMHLQPSGAFHYLSVVDDPYRCGLDLVLQAFNSRFSGDESVHLWIYPSGSGKSRTANLEVVRKFVAGQVRSANPCNIHLIEDMVPWREMPTLFNAVNAVVMPYRHDNFGVELARAISCEKPVITTNHGGAAAFTAGGNIQLVSFRYIDAPESAGGQGNWVEPSFEELTDKLAEVVDHFESMQQQAAAAASELANDHGISTVREQLEDRFSAIENKLLNPTLEPVEIQKSAPVSGNAVRNDDAPEAEAVRLYLEGSMEGYGSVQVFNRHLGESLEKAGYVVFCNQGGHESAFDHGERSVLIRNTDNPRFSKPSHGRWVHMHDWTLGRIPQDWVPSLSHVDEIWVTSESQRRAYVDSGVDPSKLVVIPAGVDTNVFNPGATPMDLGARRIFRFLFVGDGHWQRGADILLGAYYQTFKGKSNVELVVVDTEVNQERSSLRALVDQFQSKLSAPAVRYMKGDFSDEQYAGLYRASNCFVYPYRTEAMGLRVLEAMACGLPVIVTGGGATDDFVGDEHGYRVPSLRRWVGANLNPLKLVGRGFYMEADSAALGAEMTHVLYHETRARAVGEAAARWVAANRTWDHAVSRAADRITLMARKPIQKDSSTETSPQFRGFWEHFESMVENGKFQTAWQFMSESIERHPFHPDACHGLYQLASSNGWVEAAEAVRSWMVRWMPRHVISSLYPQSGRNTDNNGVTPEWVKIPSVLLEQNELPKLTVVMEGGTFDAGIRATLEPLAEVAHQIIISSRENSPDFALLEEFEAEWVRESADRTRGQNRNQLLEKATGDWILFLRPGEILRSNQLAQLAQALSETGVLAGYFPRVIFHGQNRRSREFALRLFRNAPGLEFFGDSLENLGGEWEALQDRWDLRIAHQVIYLEAHEEPVSQLSPRDGQRRIQLEALVARHPDDARIRLNLAEEFEACGIISDAEEQYQEILRLLSAQSVDADTPALVEATVTNLALIHLRKNSWNEIMELFSHPLVRKNGLTSSMHYIKGKAFLGLGGTDEAMVEFTKAWEKKGENSYFFPLEEIAETGFETRVREVIFEAGFPRKALAWEELTRQGQSAPVRQRGNVEELIFGGAHSGSLSN